MLKQIYFVSMIIAYANFGHTSVTNLALLEMNDKKVLLIGDLHLPKEGNTAKHVPAQRESIRSIKSFIDELAQTETRHDWIMESTQSGTNKLMSRASLAEQQSQLLYSIPVAFEEVGQTSFMQFKHSDRREGIAQLFVAGRILSGRLLNECKQILNQLNLLTGDYLREEGNGFVSDVTFAKIEKSLKSNAEFRQAFVARLKQFASAHRNFEFENYGLITTPLRVKLNVAQVKSELQKLLRRPMREEMRILLKDRSRELEDCEVTISNSLRPYPASDSILNRAFDAAIKDGSPGPITNLGDFEHGFGRCIAATLADIGFLIDVVNSQEENGKTVVLVGAAHTSTLSKMLLGVGYEIVFQEGRFLGEEEQTGHFKALDTSVVNLRLNQVVEAFRDESIAKTEF